MIQEISLSLSLSLSNSHDIIIVCSWLVQFSFSDKRTWDLVYPMFVDVLDSVWGGCLLLRQKRVRLNKKTQWHANYTSVSQQTCIERERMRERERDPRTITMTISPSQSFSVCHLHNIIIGHTSLSCFGETSWVLVSKFFFGGSANFTQVLVGCFLKISILDKRFDVIN